MKFALKNSTFCPHGVCVMNGS